ncbi:MAG: hypothetical protein ABFD07_14250 [Methanobacterium sp.]
MDDISSAFGIITIQLAAKSEAARKALDEHVEKVYLISTENYCPVDRGNLKESAENEVVTDTPTEYTRRISYGGDTAPYAFWVHERLNLNHTNPPAACAKFLERAVVETQSDLEFEIMQAALI